MKQTSSPMGLETYMRFYFAIKRHPDKWFRMRNFWYERATGDTDYDEEYYDLLKFLLEDAGVSSLYALTSRWMKEDGHPAYINEDIN